jgi:hypothetical protein
VLNEKERRTREEGRKRKRDREKERKHLLRYCETVLAGHIINKNRYISRLRFALIN